MGPPVRAAQDETPAFEYFLYNSAGRLVKWRLSIHEVQRILLQQSQDIGLESLGWLIERPGGPGPATPPPDLLTTLVTAQPPAVPAASHQLLGLVHKVKDIVAAAAAANTPVFVTSNPTPTRPSAEKVMN